MNATRCKTRICTLESLDEKLRAAIRAHETEYGLAEIESDILMCCETITIHQKKGFLGGIQIILSAVYITPKWLVWVDSTGRNDAVVGATELQTMDLWDTQATTHTRIIPAQGLSITGRYTDKNKAGITFIALDSNIDGQKFRQVLEEALSKAA
jgi:hypothetical protein